MSEPTPRLEFNSPEPDQAELMLAGDWVEGQEAPEFADFLPRLAATAPARLTVSGTDLGQWDSLLMAFLLQLHIACAERDIDFDTRDLPEGVVRLLDVATAVKPHREPDGDAGPLLARLNSVTPASR